MRLLAERAGVSLVTPYNLFGSKKAIMQALLDEDIARFAAELERGSDNPLEMLFRVVSLGNAYFKREPGYYRAVIFAILGEGGEEYRMMFGGPRRALWHELVEHAIADKYLRDDVDAALLADHLSAVYFINILEWLSGETSLSRVEYKTRYAFAMALCGVARQRHVGRLREQIAVMQDKLKPRARRKTAS